MTKRILIRLLGLLLLPWIVICVSNCRNIDNRPNIVLMLIDQLRADRLGYYGSTVGLSPNLDTIARGGFYFSAARAAAPWTWPSVCSLHTGLYPLTHGADRAILGERTGPRILPLSSKAKTLAEYLGEEGYETAAFVANPYLKPEGKFNQGFDHYEHEFVKTWLKTDARWWQKDSYSDTLTRQTLKYVRSHKNGPQFLYIHYIDVHGPWDSAPFVTEKERVALSQQTEVDPILDQTLYHRSIQYVDRNIGFLVEQLKQEYGSNVLFVITADHGRSLAHQDSSNRWKISKGSLHEFNLKVPLIFSGPKTMPFHGNSDADVSLVDVLPTLLEIVSGKQTSLPMVQGSSLLPILQGRTLPRRTIFAEVNDRVATQIVSMQAMMNQDTKYIQATAPSRATFRYNLTEDPFEMADPLSENQGANDPAFLLLKKAFAAFRQNSFGEKSVALDEETAEQLRSLGYVQ